MHRLQRVAHRVRRDHAAFLHQHLAGGQPALAVFVVDQRQPLLVALRGQFGVAALPGIEDLADAVGKARAGHGAGGAGFQVGHQRDGLFAVPWADDGVAAQFDQLTQLGRGLRHLDLEVRHIADLARHARQERRAQGGAADGRVLDHDGDVDGVRDRGEELMDAALGHADGGAVVRRHHHHHGGAGVLRRAAALGAQARAEMRGGDDHWHAPVHVFQHGLHQHVALVVAEHELLGEIGQDAQAVRAGIDHEVDAAALAVQVKPAVRVEDGGRHREYAAVDGGGWAAGHWSVSGLSVKWSGPIYEPPGGLYIETFPSGDRFYDSQTCHEIHPGDRHGPPACEAAATADRAG
ncbi:protein of unknown function [Cupriavidus taiwanensis]|nr:protein of unknown function [Cupriavidus taiwanensis]